MLGEPRIHVDECESTQLLLDPSMPEGAVATTRHQTGGRGRRGRTWQDVPGASLLFSVLLKPPADRRAQELTLVGALAVAETVDAQIKWPNDVLIDGRKVSGGIAELRDGAVILGIGINVSQTAEQLPADARVPATSLRLNGRTCDLDDLLAALDSVYSTWRNARLGALHSRISERDALRGRTVTVDSVSGLCNGIAADGRLEIAGEFVESGEVTSFA
ncbi:MAG TPA: biotin--[acetyl-CoA-carboxylase] ligase [Casimicrobiaceae bacterium]|nr:biotin--[acetyl-CoA-carboxylase] ligase [Casimicrobiaceae bacterium]